MNAPVSGRGRRSREAIRLLIPAPVRRAVRRLGLADTVLGLLPAETNDAVRAWRRQRSPTELDEWEAIYVESLTRAYRRRLVSAVDRFAPIGTVLELGCHVGPNLRLLASHFPEASITGVDVNEQIVTRAQTWLSDLTNVVVICRDLREYLSGSPSLSVDCIVSSYSLAYLDPNDLVDTLREAWRVARKGIVVEEPHALPGEASRRRGIEWRHDYVKAWRSAIAEAAPIVQPLPPSERHNALNAVVIVSKGAHV